jgi:hypothetical protein
LISFYKKNQEMRGRKGERRKEGMKLSTTATTQIKQTNNRQRSRIKKIKKIKKLKINK